MSSHEHEMDLIDARHAHAALERMLSRAGVTVASADTRVLWDIFKRFAQRPALGVDADADGDLVLFDAPNRFEIALIRQFAFTDEDQEYLGMEQLQLRRALSTQGGAAAPVSIWGVARARADPGDAAHEGIHPDLESWVRAVEASPAFGAALEASPGTTTLRQGPI